jgi:hypothetical protein
MLEKADLLKLKGIGKGVFGDPVEYQEKLRKEWEN